jgi:hypothetical protein
MAWIQCNFHGSQTFDNNSPVNLSLVRYFSKGEEGDIIFMFDNEQGKQWEFENNETRDKEYLRVLELATANKVLEL